MYVCKQWKVEARNVQATLFHSALTLNVSFEGKPSSQMALILTVLGSSTAYVGLQALAKQ